MASLYNADLKPLTPGVYTHYYTHATKLFIADTFRLAPKQSFLYYVCININESALTSLLASFGGNSISSQSLLEQYQTGILAKRVDMPKFNIDTKTYNAYNRKNIVTNKINYDPISVTFHDDAADIVTNFWNDYYTYYFRDSDYTEQLYGVPHKYENRLRNKWGYTPRMQSLIPFLRSIQIFSLHNKRFTEYELINPTITNWRHGELDSSNSSGIVDATMTVAYETVKYKTGFINVTEMPGFGTINYDNFPSPISKSVTNIYTDAGIIGTLAGGARDLARPDNTGSGKGLTSQALDVYRTFQNLKNVNFKSVAGVALGQVGAKVLDGVINSTLKSVFAPTLSGTPGYGGPYGSSQLPAPVEDRTISGALTSGASPYPYPVNTNAVTLGGTLQAAGQAIVRAPVAAVNSAVDNLWNRGVNTVNQYIDRNIVNPVTTRIEEFTSTVNTGIDNAVNQVNAEVTKIFQTTTPSDGITIDSETGQPITGEVSVYSYQDFGQSEEFSLDNTQVGSIDGFSYDPIINDNTFNSDGGYDYGYDSNYAENNIISDSFSFASPAIRTITYADGTVVIRNNQNQILQIYPGSSSAPTPKNNENYILPPQNTNVNPTSTRDLAASGAITLPTQTQLYNNLETGQITVLNKVNVRVVNRGAGLVPSVSRGSTTIGGGSVVNAQIGSAFDSAATKNIANYVAPGGLQPIRNPTTGTILQGVNSVTGSIQNVVGTWVGTGGYNPRYPQQNVISKTSQLNGDIVYTYKDGTVVTTSATGEVQNIVKGPITNPYTQWYSASQGEKLGAAPMQPGLRSTDAKGNPITALNNPAAGINQK